MNIREISNHEVEATLLTLDKIFKEAGAEPSGALLSNLSPSVAAKKLEDSGFRFFSAFENGGEMATVALKGNHICTIGVKKYAQKRGVGTTLIKEILKLYPKGSKVTVNADEQAVPFYTQLGFSPDNPVNPIIEEDKLRYIPMHIIV